MKLDADYVRGMEIPLTPDQEAQLHQLASMSGCGANQLAHDVLSRFLEHEASFRAAVRVGRDQIERGEGIAQAEVVARLERRYGA